MNMKHKMRLRQYLKKTSMNSTDMSKCFVIMICGENFMTKHMIRMLLLIKDSRDILPRMNIIFWNSLIRNIILGFGNLAGSFSPLTEAICQYINTKKAINRLNSNYTEPKSIIGPSSIMRIGYS